MNCGIRGIAEAFLNTLINAVLWIVSTGNPNLCTSAKALYKATDRASGGPRKMNEFPRIATLLFMLQVFMPTQLPASTDDCSAVVDECPVAGGVTWQCKKRFVYGVNYAWHSFSGDFGGISAHNEAGVATRERDVDQELAEMKDHGASVVRWWVMPDFRGDGVTFDANDVPTGLGETFEKDLLKALELAEKNDIYLMLTIFSFDNFKPTYTSDGVKIRSLQPIAIDAAKRKALIEKVIRPMVRIGESSPFKKRLMTWELINEPEWAMAGGSKYDDPDYECSGDSLLCVSHEQMETLLKEMTAVIRAESKALVSVGGAAIKWKNAWTALGVDYYQFHLYDWVNQYYPYSNSPADWNLTDKPIVMGEYPIGGVPGADETTLLSSWHKTGFAGALAWAMTDSTFDWKAGRGKLKDFGVHNSCQTKY